MNRIGVAVIGAGMVGRAHAAGYRSASTVFGPGLPPVDLVTIADLNGAFAKETAHRFGYEKSVTDWREILQDDRIHVVSVAVANSLHKELSEALLAAGKHVLCEKPLAPTTADAKSMVEAAKKSSGQQTGTGFTFRRSPAIGAIKNELTNGNLGKPYFFNVHYWCDYAADPTRPMSWRYKGAPGSGALADIGSHIVDLAEFMFGQIESVSGAVLTTFIKERAVPTGPAVGHAATELSDVYKPVENEDLVTFTAKFASGATGTMSSSRVAHGLANSLGFEIHSEKGAATFDLARMGEFGYYDSTSPHQTAGYRQVFIGPAHPYIQGGMAMDFPTVNYGQNDLFVWQARGFLEQVAGLNITPKVASFEEGLRNLVILDAIVDSSHKGGAEVIIS